MITNFLSKEVIEKLVVRVQRWKQGILGPHCVYPTLNGTDNLLSGPASLALPPFLRLLNIEVWGTSKVWGTTYKRTLIRLEFTY